MNYAAVLKPAKEAKPAAPPRYLKEGWVNLRTWKPTEKVAVDDLDARLKEAAVVLRRRWDQWNSDHGIDYDYERECSCSDHSSDDDGGDAEAEAGEEDADVYNDYQYRKKLN